MARPCPQCKRPNNELAERCIYCGKPLPAAPAGTAPETAAEGKTRPAAPLPELYHVIVSPAQPLKADRLKAFAELFRLDEYSAKLKLKQPIPWVARSTTSPEQAKAMSQQLAELGLEAYVVKQSGLDKLSDRVLAAGLKALDEKGLTVVDAEGKEARLDYDDLFLVVRGRLQERSERKESLVEDERPEVQLGKMFMSGEDGEPESGFRARLGQFKVKPRAGRLRWALRGNAVEIMDLYLKSSPRSFRVVESEFDYSGLGPEMKQSGLLNFKRLFNAIQQGAPGALIDEQFKLVENSLSDLPREDQLRIGLMEKLGASRSGRKVFDNRALFDDYSARVYLHHFRKSRKPPAAPKPPDKK